MKYILSLTIFVGLVWFTLPMKLKDGQLETVLSNDRVLSNYIKCLLDQGACTREGSELKKFLPDAIQSDCSTCSSFQKRNTRKIMTHLRTRRPQDWKALTDKYDPQGLFKQRLDAGLV